MIPIIPVRQQEVDDTSVSNDLPETAGVGAERSADERRPFIASQSWPQPTHAQDHGTSSEPAAEAPESEILNPIVQAAAGEPAHTQSWSKGDEAGHAKEQAAARSKRKRSWYDRIQDSWAPELAACSTAVLIVGIQVGVLGWNQHRPVSEWSWTLQLNSLLALLATCFDAVLMFALASCLGQLKWTWYRTQDKPLIWMDRFSHGSTAAGAMQMLSLLLYHRLWR